jgi:hypothetical protein
LAPSADPEEGSPDESELLQARREPVQRVSAQQQRESSAHSQESAGLRSELLSVLVQELLRVSPLQEPPELLPVLEQERK